MAPGGAKRAWPRAGRCPTTGGRRPSSRLGDLRCEDPLTGLVSLAYLRTRPAEIYREGTARLRPEGVVDVIALPGRYRDAPATLSLWT